MSLTIRTSVVDEPDYRNACVEAVKDHVFPMFRRLRDMIRVVDTVSQELGVKYVDYIKSSNESFLNNIEEFKKNDLAGDPVKFRIPEFGLVCPTTVRYVKMFVDITNMFGDLNGFEIIEIGGGYGGLARIVSTGKKFKKYLIIDLPETIRLQKRYLDFLQAKNVDCVNALEAFDSKESDLLISTFALSECSMSVQEEYIQKVVSKAKRGYLVWNNTNHHYGVSSYSLDEFQRRMLDSGVKIQIKPEDPPCGGQADLSHRITWSP